MMNNPPLEPLSNHPSSSNFLTVPKQRVYTERDKHRRTPSSIDTQGESRNSSAKVWADDYYTFDFGFEGESQGTKAGGDSLLAAPPSALLSSHASSLAEEHLSRTPAPYQYSFASLLPSFKTSPKRSSQEEDEEFMPTYTGDRGGAVSVADRSKGGLVSWFSGASAPTALGVPAMDEDVPSVVRPAPRDVVSRQSSEPPDATPPRNLAGSSTSRFNFFSSPKSPTRGTNTIQLPAQLNSDELLTLNIDRALFPGGKKPEDPFSPSAFKNLLMNAEGLLLKLQTAYKVRTVALHEIIAEKETSEEELDEVKTRAQCYKVQIEDLAHQNSVKDEQIKALERELLAERRARAEEKEARERSAALVKDNSDRNRKRISESELSIDTQLGGEDLGIASAASIQRRKWRSSAISTDASAADDDSDVESRGGESVFSRSRSPVLTINSSANISLADTELSTPEIMQGSFARVRSPTQPIRPRSIQQRSTFQKILTTISSSPENSPGKDEYGSIGLGQEGCSNCQGKSASVAWDTVGLIRAENKGLKEKLEELETANEGALDFIYGLGLPRS